jgi:hypothetical protein
LLPKTIRQLANGAEMMVNEVNGFELGIWNLELGRWNLEFGIWNLESGIWNLECAIWHLEFGTCK